MGLLGHEDEVVVGGGCVLGFEKCVSAPYVPFRVIEYNTNGELDIACMRTTLGLLGAASGSLGT